MAQRLHTDEVLSERQAQEEKVYCEGKPLKNFTYRDHGSLVSLSQYTAIGVLMGNFGSGQSLNVRGWVARMAYISLYRLHQIALHGWFKASLLVVADKINHIVKPRLKLH